MNLKGIVTVLVKMYLQNRNGIIDQAKILSQKNLEKFGKRVVDSKSRDYELRNVTCSIQCSI